MKKILDSVKINDHITVETVRKDFKKRSEVKVRNGKWLFATYRFDNVDLGYESQYLNWENLNCCGGWVFDKSYLKNAVQLEKKLFAQVILSSKEELDEIIDSLEKKYPYRYEKLERFENPRFELHICKEGCVKDYIDLKKVFAAYEKLGIFLDDEDRVIVEVLAEEQMSTFMFGDNRFKYEYDNPCYIGELVFSGLLLGYPIESTASLLEQRGRYSPKMIKTMKEIREGINNER